MAIAILQGMQHKAMANRHTYMMKSDCRATGESTIMTRTHVRNFRQC